MTKNISELMAEFYIPYAIDCIIKEAIGRCELLSTTSRWFEVTFKEDRPGVVAKFQELADKGVILHRYTDFHLLRLMTIFGIIS